jgi:hypothetical protein
MRKIDMAKDLSRSNSLTDLAARIKAEHREVGSSVRRGLEHAINAGELLQEAKDLVGYRNWMSWVKKYCAIPHRTVNLYMRLAKHKSEIGNVANLSVREAIKMLTESAALDGTGPNGHRYWLTPPDLMARLKSEFGFDFDPCPHPRPDDFDGLQVEWGKSNYVNPPFTGPTACVRKAITEHGKGKSVVFVFPIDAWVLMMLEAGAQVRNLGKVNWRSIEDGTQGKGAARPIAAFVLKKD